MFGTVAPFSKQFTPVEGGYLIFPSKKSGGKLVTQAEYDRLLADWKRIAGTVGILKAVAVLLLVISAWTVALDTFSLPERADTLFTSALVVMVVARFFWAGLAPRRLIKGRPEIAPPRHPSAARREARAAINWPITVWAICFFGAAFIVGFGLPKRTWGAWAWFMGSGTLLLVYVSIAVKKLIDRQRE